MLSTIPPAPGLVSFNGEPNKTDRLFPEVVPMRGLVPPDQELRMQFVNFKIAAFRGNTDGMLGLANMYLQGSIELYIEQDFVSAEYWFWQALRYRNVNALISLAGLYSMGAGKLPLPDAEQLFLAATQRDSIAQARIINILTQYIPPFFPICAV